MTLVAQDMAVASSVDGVIDGALDRIRDRGRSFGGWFEDLTDALAQAGTGGKRLRPAVVAAAYEALGGDDDGRAAMHDLAAAFELLHTAFVVHDDVIDHDTVRRGLPNISGRFRSRAELEGADAAGAAAAGEAAAILAGDLVLSEAWRLVALADVAGDVRLRLLDLIDDAILVSAAGELADVRHSVVALEIDPEELLRSTHDKTAVYSFAAPLAVGAVLAGSDETEITAVRAAGSALGLAFQLADDLIGAFGTAAQAGRAAGADLREGKQTPLVALARESGKRDLIESTLRDAHRGAEAVRRAQRALEESGARERVRRLVDISLAAAGAAVVDERREVRELVGDLARLVCARLP